MLLKTCDACYPVPGRTLISKEIDTILTDLKAQVQQYHSSASKVNLCADIWTKRGMTSSYLGLTAHFFSQKDHKRRTATLAVRKMAQVHSGENIHALTEEILEEWDIPLNKIGVIMTMVATC